MRAVVVDGDDQKSLRWDRVEPLGALSVGQVRIATQAAGVNRADLIQRAGLYPPPPGASKILGLEIAGVVTEVGQSVANFAEGDRVMALLSGGGYASEVVVEASQVLALPLSWTMEEGAATMETLSTVVLNLMVEGGAVASDRVLVHAGGSGVGTMAISLCRMIGAEVCVTVGGDDKLLRCGEMGAKAGTNRHKERFVEQAMSWTDGHGFDLILDPVGGRYLADNQRCLALGGRLVVIGILGGRMGKLDMGRLLVKRQRVIGSVLRSRSLAEKSDLVAMIGRELTESLESGVLKPVIDQVFPIEQVESAHKLMAGNQTFGKLVLTLP